MKNIVLIGFMGTGKTTIATKVASELDMEYVSIDDIIVKREKRTINEMFTKSGEDHFRDIESSVVREVSARDGLVIDTGGGVVLREENIENLKSGGTVICLTAAPEVIYERTKKYKHRPLLNVEDPKLKIRELMTRRQECYQKADHVIDTGELTINQAIKKIIDIMKGQDVEKS